MRTRAERRHNDWKKAKRKWRMDVDTAPKHCVSPERLADAAKTGHMYNTIYWLWYDNLHQYSKNKIHCSCSECSCYHKTNNKGKNRLKHGNYAPSYNPSQSERRQVEHMGDVQNDYECDSALFF